MAYRKNDRVKFMNGATEVHGVVLKGGIIASVIEDSMASTYRVSQQLLRESTKPLPPKLKEYLENSGKKFSKGDRVMFSGSDGEVVHGTVQRAGASVTVIQDGGDVKWQVSASTLKPSDITPKKDSPHEMDRWGVSGYKAYESMSEETLAFEAYITMDGEKVLYAKNDGQGGPNIYHPINKQTYKVVSQFEQCATDWLVDHGYPEDRVFEGADTWINWKANKAPYNVTAKEEVESELAFLEEMGLASG